MHGVEIWDKVNESAKVVAWPGVVTLGMVMFRTKLGELFQRLREAVVPGGSVKFDPGAQIAANQGIARSGGTLVASLEAEIEAAQGREDSEDHAEPERPNPAAVMSEIRDDIEDLIRASFKAGFSASDTMHQMGRKPRPNASPEPVIEWEGPVPTVSSYRLDGALIHVPSLAAIVDRMFIESQAAELRTELYYIQRKMSDLRVHISRAKKNDGGVADLQRVELAELEEKRDELNQRILATEAHLEDSRARIYGA